ncbi:hypothetical protein DFH07DRAFT_957459 [Mycena maculata]|uniref:Uncharacterized protein n=1 Tax=Mycena maculata TaxID=230809 RepID=A0AAD7NHV1_9AGAR|nr:hypothetical protein DFH07DRAFT_957459 [Mycena maculata]
MKTFTKLLPRLRKRESRRSPPPSAVKRPIWPQPIILEGVLDISKELRDALAREERQEWSPVEIAFPPGSPTASGGSCSPGKRPEASSSQTPSPSSASPIPSPELPHSVVDAHTAGPPPRDMLASELGRRRNFRGRRLDTTLTIPPMPTTPPPLPIPWPCTCSASPGPLNLRRQPRFTDLNTASPIRRCLTFPVSNANAKGAPPRSKRSSDLAAPSADGEEDAVKGEGSTTLPGTPSAALMFPFPPRATFTKWYMPPAQAMPNSAMQAMFAIGEADTAMGVEPLFVVKRVSEATAPLESPPVSPVMDELLSSLNNVYTESQDPDPDPDGSFVTISLESATADDTGGDDDLELEGEVTFRITYSLTEEYASFFRVPLPPPPPPPPPPPGTPERPCAYTFLVGRARSLSTIGAEEWGVCVRLNMAVRGVGRTRNKGSPVSPAFRKVEDLQKE